ncbi:hypothetical protein Ferpe_1781 [Fervidobacterium pennivorans DSM 9078]|uniref:Uncharacterized protein n=1 Tax=Fervidobacterium pennivorans (strain DSM 9078 / Ven5) TaxID=771875 RepID=H9UE91_FERPD|nr:hypothetical protein [Fervidobacterium pennivorans]AFG35834.1 hypothetical protein Ferpe_1781 [Fervidobacterium pennivorans DSM 9078]
MKRVFVAFVTVILSYVCFGGIIFNNTHLERLSQQFTLNGEIVKGYWVYANNKGDYFEVTTAQNEGDFCVDDVARVVLLYTEAYEILKEEKYLSLAIEASKFVLQMQATDGEFYNFAWQDGTINKYGVTSEKSSSWWTLRAFAALSKLSQYYKDTKVVNAVRKAYSAIKKSPPVYGDQLAMYILGLSYYVISTKDENAKKELMKYANELINYQWKEYKYLPGFFSVYQDKFNWNGWGNHYPEALIEAYKIVGDNRYLSIARESLDSQVPLLLSTGLIYSIGRYVKLFPELAYALECVAVPSVKLYEMTKDENYAYYSALLTSWLFGGNRLNIRMLGENGEGYDGLEYMHYNRNAGAESTICALRTLLYATKLPEDFQNLATKPVILGRNGMIVLEVEAFDPGLSSVRFISGDFGGGAAFQIEGKAKLKKEISEIPEGHYFAFLSGDFKNTTVIVSSKSQVKKEISGSGIFEIGEIEVTGTINVSVSSSCLFDQIILIPQNTGITFKISDKGMTLYYDFNNRKTIIVDDVLFLSREDNVFTTLTVKLKVVDTFIVLELRELFNNDGFAIPQKPGNFDNLGGIVGAYLPENEVSEGVIAIKGVPFEIVANGNDNVRCDGQKIVFQQPINCSKIYILAAANHGDYKADFLINQKVYSVKINDWCNQPNAVEFDYRYMQNGERQYIKCGLSLYELDISNLNEELKEIILPREINVHIFGITLK